MKIHWNPKPNHPLMPAGDAMGTTDSLRLMVLAHRAKVPSMAGWEDLLVDGTVYIQNIINEMTMNVIYTYVNV